MASSKLMSVAALLLSSGALNLGLALQSTLLGVRAELEAFATPVTGLIMSGYYLGFVAGSYYGPTFVNRVGHIRTFAALASLASAATLIHAEVVQPTVWFILRTATGFCFAGLCMVVESWLNERSDDGERGTMLALYMSVILGATVIGQVLLNISEPGESSLFILVSVILSVALIPVALTTSPTPAQIESERIGLGRLFAISPVGFVGTFGAGLLIGTFWSIGAVYALQSGLDTFGVSLFMALLTGGGLVTLMPLGRISDRMDRRVIIAGLNFGLFLLAAGVVLGLLPKTGQTFFVCAALCGALGLPLYSLSIALANDFADAVGFVPISSGLLLVFGIGAAAGPTLAAGTMQVIGTDGFFVFSGAVSITVAMFTIYRMTRRTAAATASRGEFVAMPRTTPMAYELAPVEKNAQSDRPR